MITVDNIRDCWPREMSTTSTECGRSGRPALAQSSILLVDEQPYLSLPRVPNQP